MSEIVPPGYTPPPPADSESSPFMEKNTNGTIALLLSLFALVMAFIPFLSAMAWLPGLAVLVFAIIGLTRKGQRKGTSISALIISTFAWVASIIMTLVYIRLV